MDFLVFVVLVDLLVFVVFVDLLVFVDLRDFAVILDFVDLTLLLSSNLRFGGRPRFVVFVDFTVVVDFASAACGLSAFRDFLDAYDFTVGVGFLYIRFCTCKKKKQQTKQSFLTRFLPENVREFHLPVLTESVSKNSSSHRNRLQFR